MSAYTFGELKKLPLTALNSLADNQAVLDLTAEQYGGIKFLQTVPSLNDDIAKSIKATGVVSLEIMRFYGAVRCEVMREIGNLEQARQIRNEQHRQPHDRDE
jgi:hypothetical protein